RTSGCGSLPAQKGGRLLIRRVVVGVWVGSAAFPTPRVTCMTPQNASDDSRDDRRADRRDDRRADRGDDRRDDSRWSDLDRPPLNAAALRRALVREGSLYREVDVVQRTGSTNSDLVARGAAGTAGEGTVLVAEEQTAGKGRLDRRWSAPARSG